MMKIGIDLDDTISHAPAFFALVTHGTAGRAEIFIITRREPGTEAEIALELAGYGIRFDHIKITDKKAEFILAQGIEVYFDDTDEYFQHLPGQVKVFKTREPGNFCFESGRWFYGEKTGIDIDARRKDKASSSLVKDVITHRRIERKGQSQPDSEGWSGWDYFETPRKNGSVVEIKNSAGEIARFRMSSGLLLSPVSANAEAFVGMMDNCFDSKYRYI